jgi:hypothetical protein
MKTKKPVFAFITFLIGAGFGIVFLGLISFTNSNISTPAVKTLPVSIDSAAHMAGNYFAAATVLNSKVVSIAVDTVQVRLMYSIMIKDKSLAGFRIYLGYPTAASKEKLGIVVGMDAKESDVTKYVYQTEGPHVGPCPTVCDGASPINHQ